MRVLLKLKFVLDLPWIFVLSRLFWNFIYFFFSFVKKKLCVCQYQTSKIGFHLTIGKKVCSHNHRLISSSKKKNTQYSSVIGWHSHNHNNLLCSNINKHIHIFHICSVVVPSLFRYHMGFRFILCWVKCQLKALEKKKNWNEIELMKLTDGDCVF